MLIRDMIKLDEFRRTEELDKAEKRTQCLSAKARDSNEPAHCDCVYYRSTEEGEYCDALKNLYCKVSSCSYEQKKETDCPDNCFSF